MATRNTPNRAFRDYLDPLEQALGCIASERLVAMSPRPRDVGPVYTIVLNNNEPVVLKGKSPIRLSAGQLCRIIEYVGTGQVVYKVQLVGYWYILSSQEGREILTYHWTPEEDDALMITTPHLHVGSVNISDTAPLSPKTFNKLHVPTGVVSLQSVVRFLITEVGVEPRRADWSEILEEASEPMSARGR